MRHQIFAVAALSVLGANTAIAAEPRDSSATSPLESLPQSIWTVDTNSVAHHVQTGLACPYTVQDFTLTSVMNFDPVGLDVSCSYARRGGGVVTLYLTKRNGQTLEDDLARVHSEIALTHAEWPVVDATETPRLTAGVNFLTAF